MKLDHFRRWSDPLSFVLPLSFSGLASFEIVVLSNPRSTLSLRYYNIGEHKVNSLRAQATQQLSQKYLTSILTIGYLHFLVCSSTWKVGRLLISLLAQSCPESCVHPELIKQAQKILTATGRLLTSFRIYIVISPSHFGSMNFRLHCCSIPLRFMF